MEKQREHKARKEEICGYLLHWNGIFEHALQCFCGPACGPASTSQNTTALLCSVVVLFDIIY